MATADPDPVFAAGSRPEGALRWIIAVFALGGGIAAALLARSLAGVLMPGWAVPAAAGAAVAAAIAWFAMLGARIVVRRDGVLTYRLHGRDNLTLPLSVVTAVRPVADGWVRGIGLELSDPRQVVFLHRAGISPARMRRWREELGVDLVCEGFPPAVSERLGQLAAEARRPGAGVAAAAI